MKGSRKISSDNWAGGVQGDFAAADGIRSETPFPTAPVKTTSAKKAYKMVLKNAGAMLPQRDSYDERIIREAMAGKCAYGDSYGPLTGIIDSQDNTAGWPDLKTYNIVADNDKDGMSDTWEKVKGLNPDDPEDRNKIAPSGYTMLEEYINSLTGSSR